MQPALCLPETLPDATLPLLHHTNAPPTPPLVSIPCNLPFAYLKRYLALLCRLFTISVHADATTHTHTMQQPLRLPKTLPDATLPPFHHTSAQRRRLCQYHATHPSPTKNATSRYLALLCHRFTIPVHHRLRHSRQYHATHPLPTKNATSRYLALLCHRFTIPVHADAATRVNTMQPTLCLPKTLPDATSPPVRHTCDHRRCQSCQYHEITSPATQNAIWRYFAASSPYQLTPKLPLMSILWNHHFSYPKRYMAPLCRQFTILAHADATIHVNTMESPLQLPQTLPDATSPSFHHISAPPPPPLMSIPCNLRFAYQKRYLALLCRYFTTIHLGCYHFHIPTHHRRHYSYQYHATHTSPTKNATWRYFATSSLLATLDSTVSPHCTSPTPPFTSIPCNQTFAYQKRFFAPLCL